jgi:hypothetical protein
MQETFNFLDKEKIENRIIFIGKNQVQINGSNFFYNKEGLIPNFNMWGFTIH